MFALHKQCPHYDGSIVIFDGCLMNNYFTKISSYIKVFYLGKDMACQYILYLMSPFCLGIKNNSHLYKL